MGEAAVESAIYKNFEQIHHNRATKVLENLQDEGCSGPEQVADSEKVLRYSSGVVAVYCKNLGKDIQHAVFDEEGRLLSVLKEGGILSKDGEDYVLATSGEVKASKVAADSSQVKEIEEEAQKYALEHVR